MDTSSDAGSPLDANNSGGATGCSSVKLDPKFDGWQIRLASLQHPETILDLPPFRFEQRELIEGIPRRLVIGCQNHPCARDCVKRDPLLLSFLPVGDSPGPDGCKPRRLILASTLEAIPVQLAHARTIAGCQVRPRC